MKEVFIFFACFYIFQISQAQSVWAPIGATWHYQENYYTSADTGFATFYVSGDTTILGKTCSVIKGSHGYWYMPGNDSVTYTYKSNDTVFVLNKTYNCFVPVFFFNLNVSDVWNVVWNNCTYNYLVDSIKNINILGYSHKVFYLKELNHFIHFKLIEDIGCYKFGIFPSESFWCDNITVDGSILDNLWCYQDSLHGLWETGLSPKCEYITHVPNNESQNPKVIIYPNPSEDCFWVEPKSYPASISIFNLQGQLMQQELMFHKTRFCPVLMSGVYFIKVQMSNQIYETKIIIY